MVLHYGPDGTLDPGFATGGALRLEHPTKNGAFSLDVANCRDIAEAADGKIVLAGSAPKPYLMRLNALWRG